MSVVEEFVLEIPKVLIVGYVIRHLELKYPQYVKRGRKEYVFSFHSVCRSAVVTFAQDV